MKDEKFTNGALTIEVTTEPDAIFVRWHGKSTGRNPGQFILPILTDVLETATNQKKPIVIDFQRAEYFNSSTITPIIRILESAKMGSNQVTVLYDKNLKWQALSFTALEVFHTDDERIKVRGV